MAVLLSSTKLPRVALIAQQAIGMVDGLHFMFEDANQAIVAHDGFTKIKSAGASERKPLQRWIGSELPGVALILDNHWVRTFVCQWGDAIRTHQDFIRYSEIEFERRFHHAAKDWTLVPDRLHPGGETVWCAYRPEQLKSLELAAKEAGLRIQSCLPCIVAEVALLELSRSDAPMIYISGGDQSKNVCWIENGRVRDLIVLSRDTLEGLPLVDLFLTRLKRPPLENVSILRTQGSRIGILKNLVAWQPPSTTVTSLAYPYPTAERIS
jgi:hypothetical protein